MIQAGHVAVITGGAHGIGYAAAERYLKEDMKVVMADVNETALETAQKFLSQRYPDKAENLHVVKTDVTKYEEVEKLRDYAFSIGKVVILMNNAATRPSSRSYKAYEGLKDFERLMSVNVFGVVHGVVAFTEQLIKQDIPAVIINTGSKQGITNPPGGTPYNMSKSAVKTLTEQLAFNLRNTPDCKVTAHLLVPGWTFTALTNTDFENSGVPDAREAVSSGVVQKPDGAWYPDQVVDYLVSKVNNKSFYIICPDNECTEEIDKVRMQWATGDIINDRPPLSRWHPEYKEAFQEFSDAKLSK